MNIFNWIKSVFKREPLYIFGTCNERSARRNRKTGEVQFEPSWETGGDGTDGSILIVHGGLTLLQMKKKKYDEGFEFSRSSQFSFMSKM